MIDGIVLNKSIDIVLTLSFLSDEHETDFHMFTSLKISALFFKF